MLADFSILDNLSYLFASSDEDPENELSSNDPSRSKQMPVLPQALVQSSTSFNYSWRMTFFSNDVMSVVHHGIST